MDMTLDNYIEKLLELKEKHGGDVIVIHKDESYELKNNLTAMCKYKSFNISYMKKETMTFIDDFDGINYDCDVYVEYDKDNEKLIKVLKV